MSAARPTGQKKVTDAANRADPDAPYGRKPDGTPRKCPPRGPGRAPMDEKTRQLRLKASKAKWWKNNKEKAQEYRRLRAGISRGDINRLYEIGEKECTWIHIWVFQPLMSAFFFDGPVEPQKRLSSARAGTSDVFYAYTIDIDAPPPLRMPPASANTKAIRAMAAEMASEVELYNLESLARITEDHRSFLLGELNKSRCSFVLRKKDDLVRTQEGLKFLREHIRWRKRHRLLQPVSLHQ